jgi:hypothetical protein
MKRNFLVAAVAAGPLLAAAPALAQVTISSATSAPVATATANNGVASDVTIASGGSIGLTAAATALTLNSNNSVNNAGSIGATNLNNTVGIDVVGGFTGTVTNSGQINITESYTPPTDPNNDGLNTGLFAQGTNRVGLEVTLPTMGSATFNGTIFNTGQITVNGQNSQGVSIQAPISGDFTELVVTPASGSTAATVANGSITITGENSIGLQITPTGGVGENMRITGISATGPGAQAAQLDGNVGGWVNISSSVVSTGYRFETRQTDPYLSVFYTQMEMQQNGAAVTLGGNIGAGFIISAPPPILSTTNLDLDNDGVPDDIQGSGGVVSYGSAPAIQMGATVASGAAPAITIGVLNNGIIYVSPFNKTGLTQTFGFINQGIISGQSLVDQLTSPFLLAPAPAIALQIGGEILISPTLYTYNSNYQPTGTTIPAVYLPAGAVTITGGLYNSGSITALSYQADATAIHIGANPSVVSGAGLVTVPIIYNDGEIFASSTQINSATTATANPSSNGVNFPNTPAPVPVNVTAILIEANSSVSTITNNGGILAELTGTAGVGGLTTAIVDKSGTLQNINNTGSIEAFLNQTLSSAPMPTSINGVSATVAIDMSAGNLPQTITQSLSPLAATLTSSSAYNATLAYAVSNIVTYQGNIYINVVAAGAGYDPIDYPSYWREIGAVTPSIVGDIYFGNQTGTNPDTLNVSAGGVVSNLIKMGGGLNTIYINGSSTPQNGASTTSTNAIVSGNITEASGGSFAITVNNGTLIDTNSTRVNTTFVNVGSGGLLEVAANPTPSSSTTPPSNTLFYITPGSTIVSTISAGAQFGLTLQSLQIPLVQTYTIIQAAPGVALSVQGGLGTIALGNTPFLYTAVASYAPAANSSQSSEVQLTVTRKTAAQLGLNAAEAGAFNAILNALPTNADLPGNAEIQQALLAQTTQASFRSVYDQLLPNQGQGIFEALDAAAERVSSFISTPPDNATHIGATSLWVQEVNERVDRSGIDSVGSDAQLLGIVGGYERMGAAGGAVGITLAYFNANENDSDSQLGSRDVANLVEAGVYYRRSIGALTLGARAAGGYGWFSENRIFAYGTSYETAAASWTGEFIDAHLGAAYEVKLFGPYYARPEVSVDYLSLRQNGYQEGGPFTAFNLAVSPQTDTQFTGQAIMAFGRQWGRAVWLRAEIRGGYREVFDGNVGDVTANFANGTPFTMAGDPDRGGWATVGFSLKTGSEFSYLALEGDADFRSGEQRYDLRVAGRSVF